MRVGEYLFQRLKALGVRHTFGSPGDFVLSLYQALERTSIQPIVVTHEPSAGFAADAYARIKGLGVALVGDGGFQMTGMDLGTAKAHGLRPIVILFNNGGFATMQAIAGKKAYFRVAPWDYVGIAESLGCRGVRVQSRAAFRSALAEALRSRSVFLIEAILSPTDVSPAWARIADEVRSRLRRPAGGRGE